MDFIRVWFILQSREKCTITNANTSETSKKPLVFKNLDNCWNDKLLNGKYNEFNTLLVDDSPYKALLNPVSFHFPFLLLGYPSKIINSCFWICAEPLYNRHILESFQQHSRVKSWTMN